MRRRLLAIDPGSSESAYVILDERNYQVLAKGKIPNGDLAMALPVTERVAIEQIGHYGTGMPAGRDVFDTCRFIGRLEQVLITRGTPYELVLRATVKAHHTGAAKAKDSNVIQALVDRFASGQPNRGKGTKANPGYFYGFAADIWQAMALAVYAADAGIGGFGL